MEKTKKNEKITKTEDKKQRVKPKPLGNEGNINTDNSSDMNQYSTIEEKDRDARSRIEQREINEIKVHKNTQFCKDHNEKLASEADYPEFTDVPDDHDTEYHYQKHLPLPNADKVKVVTRAKK